MEWTDPEATDERGSLHAIPDRFEPDRFPMTTEEFLAEYGHLVVEYQWGDHERLRTILRTSGTETYRTRDDLYLALLNGVSRNAVGRPRYSDRGDEPHEAYTGMPRSF